MTSSSKDAANFGLRSDQRYRAHSRTWSRLPTVHVHELAFCASSEGMGLSTLQCPNISSKQRNADRFTSRIQGPFSKTIDAKHLDSRLSCVFIAVALNTPRSMSKIEEGFSNFLIVLQKRGNSHSHPDFSITPPSYDFETSTTASRALLLCTLALYYTDGRTETSMPQPRPLTRRSTTV